MSNSSGFLAMGSRGRDLETVADHLEGCTACQHLLDQITRAAGPPAARHPPASMAERRRPLARSPQSRRAAAAATWIFANSGHSMGMARILATRKRRSSRPRATLNRRLGPRAYPSIDGFRIIREVGRGGMGVVYEAEEERLSRRVALKVLPASSLMQPKQVAAVRAGSPGGGAAAPHQYRAGFRQRASGTGTITTSCSISRAGALTRSCASCGGCAGTPSSSAADRGAVDHHGSGQAGLPKPGPDRPSGGRRRSSTPTGRAFSTATSSRRTCCWIPKGNVWVTDFGLAKTLEAEDLTSTGDVLGTIRYMAPERFAGRCDARSDLYSLGLTLYELVALRPAFEAHDRYELIERMRRDDPTLLRKQASWLPRDLETIIHKLIAREPARRYGTAAALAGDLRRFLEDRPIQARRASPPERCDPVVPAQPLGRVVSGGADRWA